MVFHGLDVPHLFKYSYVEGYIGCFQSGAFMNKAAINILQVLCEHTFSFLSYKCPGI